MRTKLILLVALSAATTQFASAQSNAARNNATQGAISAPAAGNTIDANPAATTETSPELVGPTAEPAAASPMVTPVQAQQKSSSKNRKKTAVDSDDSKKSPYWEPRDWSYIYNQGP